MKFNAPKPDSKKYSVLIFEIENGIIKVPKFQRDFVWSKDKTAKLLDSILKGYPIGTFIFWQTTIRMNEIKNIGNLNIQDTPIGTQVQYVLDGQQRITSLYAAYRGAQIQKTGEKLATDYTNIFVNLDVDINENDEQVIIAEEKGEKCISLSDVLNFNFDMVKNLSLRFSDEELNTINDYSTAFKTYEFSTVILTKEDIDSAIEVFTRINTGGQTLTLFEIMSAKSYDQEQHFDMQEKWEEFIKELADIQFDGISSSVILQLLSLVLSRNKECKRKTILALEKQVIINNWDKCICALKDSIDYFRTTYRIPVSRILPYDALLTSFAYFFFKNNGRQPNFKQRKYLEEFFWRMSLSFRYSGSAETNLGQDVKRIDMILENQRPDYSDIKLFLDSPQSLINESFSTGNSFCKAVLCLLAYQEPKDFHHNGKVILDNSWLKVSTSKNYHHFFPKSFLGKSTPNCNSIVNITLVSDSLKKKLIGSKGPSNLIDNFETENNQLEKTLKTHLIDLRGFGIHSNDYNVFLSARSQRMYEELKSRIDLTRNEPVQDKIHEIIRSGESETVEFKSTMRYDLRQKKVNKILEYVIAKTIAAFLNSEGGDLFIGVDDRQNALGLLDDFSTLKDKCKDGFERHLIGVINKYIGKNFATNIKITFPKYDDVQICRIKISKSSSPVFITFQGDQDFFVRLGCTSQPFTHEEASKYQKKRFPY
ncbi:MAG: DUF262 domain-containing protein [Bacteroidetes bacterium]|nr:DUF262 domain-containing protein [Bacteroidota bacterium]